MQQILNKEYSFIKLDNQNYLFYFPTIQLILEGNNELRCTLEKLSEGKLVVNEEQEIYKLIDRLDEFNINSKNIEDEISKHYRPSSLTLCITNNCNLKCLYCYAEGGAFSGTIPEKVAKSAIDFIINNAYKEKENKVHLSFHGGGEPTLELELLNNLASYFNRNSKNLKSTISIGTNGVISKDAKSFIHEFCNYCTISLDGLEFQNNLQRPAAEKSVNAFKETCKTLRFLRNNKIQYGVRVTVTKNNVNDLDKIVKFLDENYNTKVVQFEPYTEIGRAKSVDSDLSLVPETFIENYFKAITVSESREIEVKYSGFSKNIGSYFCSVANPNFTITPEGFITSCHEVLRKTDPRSALFFFGMYDSVKESFLIDFKKLEKLRKFNVNYFSGCNKCIAKYHCQGDCPGKRAIFGDPFIKNAKRCKINIAITKFDLLTKLSNNQLTTN